MAVALVRETGKPGHRVEAEEVRFRYGKISPFISLLVLLLAAALWARTQNFSEDRLVGRWTGDGVVFIFDRDGTGTLLTHRGRREFVYFDEGDSCVLSYHKHSDSYEMTWLSDTEVRLSSPGRHFNWPGFILRRSNPANPEPGGF